MVRRRFAIFRGSWICGLIAVLAVTASVAEAREATGQEIDIPASTLPQAIAMLSREAGVSIGAEGMLPDVRTRAVHGRMTVEQALGRLLSGSGYIARRVGERAWRIVRVPGNAVQPRRSQPSPGTNALPPEGDGAAAEEIVVTATKREALLDTLPLAVSIFAPTDEERSAARLNSAYVASSIEGLSLTGLGPGRNRMFLRGVADSSFTGKSQTTVAVLVDGTRLTYSAPDPDIRLVDVERVEVIKGPQGSLYGAGTLGGIYNIVTNPADLDAFSATVSSEAAMVSGGGVGLSGSAVVDAPLVKEHVGLRLVGYADRKSVV
jgi:outer membrane receptor protein involved in Fe transport